MGETKNQKDDCEGTRVSDSGFEDEGPGVEHMECVQVLKAGSQGNRHSHS